MPKRAGYFLPKWNFGQTMIVGWIYHCNICEQDPINAHLSTYLFLSAISDRCPICKNPLDFTTLRMLEQEYKGLY